MLKIILSTLISVFIVVGTVVVFYWRDAKFDPSLQDMLIFLGLIPFGISLAVLSPYVVIKWLKYRKDKKIEQSKQEENSNEVVEEKEQTPVEYVKLQVIAASVESTTGKNQEIIDRLAEHFSAELDPKLVDSHGLATLSYRIQSVDDLEQDTDEIGLAENGLHKRICSLILSQLHENVETLSYIAEHFKQSAMFYDQQLAYEYRMHPAWINPNAEIEDEEEAVTPQQVYRLNKINVHIVLASTLLHTWDEALSNQILEQFLNEVGILPQQVLVDYHYLSADNAYYTWGNLLKKIEKQDHEISFMLVVDSEIDQETLNERLWIAEKYVPAEFMSSCFLASLNVRINDLTAIKHLDLIQNEKNFEEGLKALKLDQLEQYQSEQMFLIIPDDVERPAINNQITKKFEASLIQQYHHIYPRKNLGNTQHLTKIFSFMLGLHFSDELYGFIYSVDLPFTHVIVKPIENEGLTTLTDS